MAAIDLKSEYGQEYIIFSTVKGSDDSIVLSIFTIAGYKSAQVYLCQEDASKLLDWFNANIKKEGSIA